MAISIILADDHTLVRKGIRALLEQENGFSVIAEAENGQQAVDLAEQLKPDIVLMDVGMPLLNGIEAVKQLQTRSPQTSVIILSMFSEDSVVRRAILAGARGYLLKQSLTEELLHAIRAVTNSEIYLSPGVSGAIINGLMKGGREPSEENLLENLTPRERQVMQMVAEGQTNRQIAGLLGVSEKTVDSHRTHLMQKLDLHDTPGLVRLALKFGLIFIDKDLPFSG